MLFVQVVSFFVMFLVYFLSRLYLGWDIQSTVYINAYAFYFPLDQLEVGVPK